MQNEQQYRLPSALIVHNRERVSEAATTSDDNEELPAFPMRAAACSFPSPCPDARACRAVYRSRAISYPYRLLRFGAFSLFFILIPFRIHSISRPCEA